MEQRWQNFGSAAEVYQRLLIPGQFEAWRVRFMELANLQVGERVLDVACGTGIITRAAAQAVEARGKVVGLDLSPGMLAVARSQPIAGANIEWREANALAMPFDDASFDAVLCQQGLQFFPDMLQGLREFHRVLVDGGRVTIACWAGPGECPGIAALVIALQRHIGADAAAFITGTVYRFGAAAELQGLLEAAGFREVEVRQESKETDFHSAEEFVEAHMHGTPIAPFYAAANAEAQAAFHRELVAALQGYPNDGGRFPVSCNLATARKG